MAIVFLLAGEFLSFNLPFVPSAQAGNVGINQPCVGGAGDLCADHLICSAPDGAKGQCALAFPAGYPCDPANSMCDQEASPALSCVTNSKGISTCQPKGGTTVTPATGGLTLTADKTSVSMGDTVSLTVTGATVNPIVGQFIIGGKVTPFVGSPYSLQVSTAAGFYDNTANPITVAIAGSGQQASVTINVGTVSGIAPGASNPGASASNPCTSTTNGSNPASCLYNPLPTAELTTMFLLIIRGFLSIIGIWAVMFIIVGGFRMVAAAGNEEAYTQAKKTITWAVLGLTIALLSFTMIAIVQNILQTHIETAQF